jgi:hypothetical protein
VLYRDILSIDVYCPEVSTNRISDPELDMHRGMTAEQLLDYLRSLSSYAKYCQEHGTRHDEEEQASKYDDPLYPNEVYL